jgi:hypothetical protein
MSSRVSGGARGALCGRRTRLVLAPAEVLGDRRAPRAARGTGGRTRSALDLVSAHLEQPASPAAERAVAVLGWCVPNGGGAFVAIGVVPGLSRFRPCERGRYRFAAALGGPPRRCESRR